MLNSEVIQKVSKKTTNIHFLTARIPYNNSLTLVKTYQATDKKKLIAYFNQPKDEPILCDMNNYCSKYLNVESDYLDRLNLSDHGLGKYKVDQIFAYNQPTFVLKDSELFETYPAFIPDWRESLIISSQLDCLYPPKVMILTEEELANLYFPYENQKQILVMDMQGNIYNRPNELLPTAGNLLNKYKEYLLNQTITMQRLANCSHPLPTFFTNLQFLKQYTNQEETIIPKGFPVTPNLLVFKIQKDGSLLIQKLEINYQDSHHYLVKAYNVSFPIYQEDYLTYIKK